MRLFVTVTAVFDLINIMINDDIIGATQGLELIYPIKSRKTCKENHRFRLVYHHSPYVNCRIPIRMH